MGEKLPLSRYPIGDGPGQVFHDLVAQHALRCLPGAKNVAMVKVRLALARRPKPPTGLAAVEGAVKATGEKRFHIVILYGNDRTRLRLANALAELLEIPVNGLTSNANDIPTKIGLITVVFVSPPVPVGRLSGQSGREDVAAWAVKAICEANKAA